MFALGTDSNRLRRQYNYIQQYGNQYGLYGPGGQGWVNNYDNRYPNPNYAWNNNFVWNQGSRYPQWYYSSARVVSPSWIFVSIAFVWFLLWK